MTEWPTEMDTLGESVGCSSYIEIRQSRGLLDVPVHRSLGRSIRTHIWRYHVRHARGDVEDDAWFAGQYNEVGTSD